MKLFFTQLVRNVSNILESGPKWTVQKGESGQFMSFEPSSFSHLDHLLLLRTSRFICLDGTVFLLWTAHFRLLAN